jgi:diguanylate cyclase (GGDEF)-like protein/putative nucleotidyltransferase with HDIG domain
MVSFEPIKADLKRYGTKGIVLLAGLTVIAAGLLTVSVVKVVTDAPMLMVIGAGLALVIALTSARHPIKFPGTSTGVSVSEALMFLGVVMLGPYHGTLLAVVEMLVAVRRLKVKPSLQLFNLANMILSFFVAGKLYYALSSFLADHRLVEGVGQTILVFALPLIALAFAHYLLHILVLAAMAAARGRQKGDAVRDTLPWEPVTYLACATIAGMVNYAFVNKGLVTTAVLLVLVLPIPIIIYYTFRTYHDKLGEQESHYEELTSIYDSILEMLAMAIDAKDDVTHDHIQRVKLFARRMGERVGLSELEIEAVKAGALLHDIGKIGVPAYILNKPGKLTEHEFEQMKMHTIIGADMLSNVDFRYPVVPIVRHHHERWDGRGYPDGLAGDAIPITARILTLVDNYDALRSDRPYKTGMTREEALSYIKQNAGTFFDPTLVEIFLGMADDLEVEAAAVRVAPSGKRSKSTAAMTNAKPAAGLETAPQLDRATAALNSIAETNQRVTALYEMSRTLSSILSVEDTVAILANRLSKLIPFTTCAISLFDATRSEFEIVHASGLNAERFLKRRMPAEAGITGWVITNQRPMFNTNPVLDLAFLGSETAGEYKGVIVYPLVKNGEALGAIALYSTEMAAYGSEHIQLMESAAQPASDAVHNALAFEQAQQAAFADPVTGLSSVRALSGQFERERSRSQRLGLPLSLVVVGVSKLDGAVMIGENSLSQLGKLIRQQVRETDLVARQNDDTFVVLLPESGQHDVSDVRRRIREGIEELAFAGGVSVSLGSATSPGDGSSFAELFRAATLDCVASRDSLDMVPVGLDQMMTVQTR